MILSRSPKGIVHQPSATFVVEEEIIVVLALLGMDLKRHQPLSQRRLGLRSHRSLITKDLKRLRYLKLIVFSFVGIKERKKVLG